MSKVQEVAKAVEFAKVKVVADLVKEALAEGALAQEILNEGMIKAYGAVGEAFKKTRFSFPKC